MPLGFRNLFSSSCVVSLAFLTAVALGQARDIPPKTNSTRPIDRAAASARGEEIVIDGIGVGTLYPIPYNARIERHLAGVSAGQTAFTTETGTDACMSDPTSVYCNTLSNYFWRPPGPDPTILVADDLALIATAGCELDRYVIKVTGNSDDLGTGGYSVSTALYDSCPGAFDGDAVPIPGSECNATFADNGIKLMTCSVPLGVVLPRNLYLGVNFGRAHCGLAVGAPPLKGFSADRFDFPGLSCLANFDGFVPSDELGDYHWHASFYAELYTRGECPAAYPAYKSTNHNGTYYTPGSLRRFADDISMSGVAQCNLVAYEVAVKGQGEITFDLRWNLNDGDPVDGGVIPGTRATAIAKGDDPVIQRVEFDPPIYINTSNLWVGFVTTSSNGGPILTGFPAQLGTNENLVAVYDGKQWVTTPGDPLHMAFDIALYCEDSPPTGACCDMVLTENKVCIAGENYGFPCGINWDCPGGTCVGDSVCRDDLALMNCATAAVVRPDGVRPLWRQNDTCGGLCLGGENHDLPCNAAIDCPGHRCISGPNVNLPCESDADCEGLRCVRASCEDPFPRSCGLAACCTPDGKCLDLTARECYELPPLEEPDEREYHIGQYCRLGSQHCPLGCQTGDCCAVHWTPGCEDCACQEIVCDLAPECCMPPMPDIYLGWDYWCVVLAREHCGCPPLANDECSGSGAEGAQLVSMDSGAWVDLDYATLDENDPPFCCHNDAPGGYVAATAWYKFVGPEPDDPADEYASVSVSTCKSNSGDARDSIIQVFEAADPDQGICNNGAVCSLRGQNCMDGSVCQTDDVSACDNLIPIACNDDAGCYRPNNSKVCIPNIVPGRTYYVLVGVKSEEFRDEYHLDISQGCDTGVSLPNDYCVNAESLKGGMVEPISVPFDLSGGDLYNPATLDCTSATSFPPWFNDLWYDWVAPCDGTAMIEACHRSCQASQVWTNMEMIVYEGCDCPANDRIQDGWSSCYSECGKGIRTKSFYPTGGECYKIRIGGHDVGNPAGDLTIEIDCLPCPPAKISFVDPADRTVDARQPHPSHDAEISQGITSFRIDAPNDAGMIQCWTICETDSTGSDNFVARIVDVVPDGFTVELDRPITPGSVTTLIYTDQKGGTQTGTFISHPANVNGDDRANASDVGAFIDILNGPPDAEWNGYSTDCDHSGSTTPADLLCIINLLNGGDAHQPWNGSDLPQCHDCCPAP